MATDVLGKMCHVSLWCVHHSGKWESLWLRQTARNADQGEHGGPARADAHAPLWAVPPLQTGGDGLQGHRPRQQALQVDCYHPSLTPACFSNFANVVFTPFAQLYKFVSSHLLLCSIIYFYSSLQETYEAKRNEFMGELQKKEEEMRQMFVQRVKEKEAELKEAEKEVSAFHFDLTLSCSTTYQSLISVTAPPTLINVRVMFPLSPPRSCTRNLTAWRSSTRMRRRNWRRRRSPWTTSSTRSNRKRLQQSSCRTKLSRQGAPPHSRGTKRGKSKYCSYSLHVSISNATGAGDHYHLYEWVQQGHRSLHWHSRILSS